jgi:ATP synthase protein I
MLDPEEKARLDAIGKRIAEARGTDTPGPKVADHHSQAQTGWRMVTELVAGLLIGFGIGYGLDVLFGTLPIFLVLFTFVGFAAGIRVMLRTAAELQKTTPGAGAGDEGKTDGR